MKNLTQAWMEEFRSGRRKELIYIGWTDEIRDRIVIPDEIVGEARLEYLEERLSMHAHPDIRNTDRFSRARRDRNRLSKYPYEMEETWVQGRAKFHRVLREADKENNISEICVDIEATTRHGNKPGEEFSFELMESRVETSTVTRIDFETGEEYEQLISTPFYTLRVKQKGEVLAEYTDISKSEEICALNDPNVKFETGWRQDLCEVEEMTLTMDTAIPKIKGGPGFQPEEYIRADADDYDLTSHMDYVNVMTDIVVLDDGTLQVVDNPDCKYPYLSGMMAIRDPAHPEWTTLGVGELAKYSHKFLDGRVEYYDEQGLYKTKYPDGRVEEVERPEPPAPPAEEENKYDPDATVEIDESRYRELMVMKNRWDSVNALRAEMCERYGTETVREAAALATSQELRDWGIRAMNLAQFAWDAEGYALEEIARRVLAMEAGIPSTLRVEV